MDKVNHRLASLVTNKHDYQTLMINKGKHTQRSIISLHKNMIIFICTYMIIKQVLYYSIKQQLLNVEGVCVWVSECVLQDEIIETDVLCKQR